jgi:hypothetical protein
MEGKNSPTFGSKGRPKNPSDDVARALADVLDGAVGYFSEHGRFAPYWDEGKVRGAMSVLARCNPTKAAQLGRFLD